MSDEARKPGTVRVDSTRYRWLEFFEQEADFGPAHGDVMLGLARKFYNKHGIPPHGYVVRDGVVVEVDE